MATAGVKKEILIVFVPAEDDYIEEDYGILFPNGEIKWLHSNQGVYPLRGDFTTREGQRDIQVQYEDMIKNLELSLPLGKLKFLKRFITRSYSLPTVLEPRRTPKQ